MIKSIAQLIALLLVLGVCACSQGKAVKRQGEQNIEARSADDQDEDDDEEGEEDDEDSEDVSEVEIDLADLPKPISRAIQKKYAGAILMEADKITNKDGTHFYDVEMKYQGKVLEVMYTADGEMIGEETEDD